jgi:hypothetical protein
MSDQEQEARIALLQEYGSAARTWYSVLLGLAIVFFAAVQVRDQMETFRVCFGWFQMTLWRASLAVIASQALFAIVRAVASLGLAKSVVGIKMPEHFDASKTYLEILRDEVERKRILWLGTWGGWIVWTVATVSLICLLLPLLERALFSCGP